MALSRLTDRRWCDPSLHPVWVGSPAGGAWVVLDLLDKASLVYSFGIAFEMSFDRDVIARTGCRVVGFDPDPRSAEWVKSNAWVPPEFAFMLLGLFSESGAKSFSVTDRDVMTGSVVSQVGSRTIECQFLTLDEIMRQRGDGFVDYLKMDIEGAEYEVIESWMKRDEPPPVGQLWVEFHCAAGGHTTATTEQFVRRLSGIGFFPVKRQYRRHPDHYLLVNREALPRRRSSL